MRRRVADRLDHCTTAPNWPNCEKARSLNCWRRVAGGCRLVEPALGEEGACQAAVGEERVDWAALGGEVVAEVFLGAGQVLLQESRLAEAIEHDAHAAGVVQLAGQGQVGLEVAAGLVVVGQLLLDAAQGAKADRLAVAVAAVALVVQAVRGEAEGHARLAAAQQEIGQRIADLAEDRHVVEFAIELVGAMEEPLGVGEFAAPGGDEAAHCVLELSRSAESTLAFLLSFDEMNLLESSLAAFRQAR